MVLQLLNITFQYPVWYFIFCLVFAGIGSAILYYAFDQFQGQPLWLRKVLAALRFIVLFLLAALLLAPVLKSKKTDIKKPVIVIAQDVSESVTADLKDGDQAKYLEQIKQLASSFGKDYDVKTYSFGEKSREGLTEKFSDKSTDISEVLTTVTDIYNNQNLGAIILATDGINNQGSDPGYTAGLINVPVYPIALGDTIPKKDLYIKKVYHHDIAYLKDKFTIQADIAARNCQGKSTHWQLSRIDGKVSQILQKGNLTIDNKDFFKSVDMVLDADKPGVQHYRISLSKVDGEMTTVNNVKDFYVDIIDSRLKILILANGPHPDISAIRQVISTNQNYVVETSLLTDFKKKVTDFDFVILHQLPSRNSDVSNILQQLDAAKKPRLFVVGTQTDIYKFNKIQSLLTINGDGRNTNDAQASLVQNFGLFTLDPSVSQAIEQFPPLTTMFGDYKLTGNASVLLMQKIGKIDTHYPLLMFGEFNGIKTGILAGEGIWKWRLFDYLQRQNHSIIDQLIDKSIQYLSVKEDKRKFRVTMPKNIFLENEQISFDAEVYNNSYELINDGDVSMTIKNENGKEFPYTFSKTGKYFNLNAGYFPPGAYSFVAKTSGTGDKLVFEGKFEVQPVQLELYETTANHGLLKLLAQSTSGQMVYKDEMDKLHDLVVSSDRLKPVLYQSNITQPVINLKWLFFLLLALLSAEWFMRRYYGSY